DAVALAHAAVVVDPELGHDEQREALGARARAFGTREHHVHDVLGEVVIAIGDEALGARQLVEVALDLLGPRATGADVAAGVGLGQHHGAAPVPLDDVLDEQALLLVAAELVDDARHEAAELVERGRWIGAAHHFERRPTDRRRAAEAADALGQLEAMPVSVVPGLQGLEHAGRQLDVALAVELQRDAVALDEALGELVLGDLLYAAQGLARGGLVHGREVAFAERRVLNAQELEEVELDIAQVALVVVLTHD